MLFLTAISRSEFPCLGHEHDEVLVIVDGRGHGGVVVVPLTGSDLTIVVLVSEVGKELEEGLIFSNLARDNLWVRVARIANSKVRCGNAARSIGVELAESSIDNSLSCGVERASNHDKELIKVDIAILVGVVSSEEGVSFLLGEIASALIESNEELLGINLSVTGVINGSEDSTKASDGSGTSGGHLCFNL